MRLEVVRASMDDFFPAVFALVVGRKLRPPPGEGGWMDWRLAGAISGLVKRNMLRGEAGERMLYWSNRRRSKVYIFGAGEKSQKSAKEITACVRDVVNTLLRADETDAVLLVEHLLGSEQEVDRAVAFVEGILEAGKEGGERFRRLKLSMAGDRVAEQLHETLRKALLRKSVETEMVELAFGEAVQTLQVS